MLCFSCRGETTRALTSPKTCTSKKEPALHLHKCSTMDSDARRNVNLLMIPVIAKFPDGIYKVLCWDREHIHACHTARAHTLVHICGFYSHSDSLCFSQWGSSLLRATRLCDICSISRGLGACSWRTCTQKRISWHSGAHESIHLSRHS